ncbi:MAG: hypothetical protein ACI9LO_002997 [Planctomycetota bacterium]
MRHYSDFGHSLIYVTKARVLIEALGDTVVTALLLSPRINRCSLWRKSEKKNLLKD